MPDSTDRPVILEAADGDVRLQQEVRRHLEMLGLAALVIVFSFLLQVRADDRVAFVGLDQFPLPHSCPSYALFGFKCPGCGLTRSMIRLAHGEWSLAWQAHRIGWLMGILIVLQIPYRLICVRRGGSSPLSTWLTFGIGYAMIALLIGNWLLGRMGI